MARRQLRVTNVLRACAVSVLLLAGCASDEAPEPAAPAPFTLPEGTRGVALRVSLIDAEGAVVAPGEGGQLYLARGREREPSIELAFEADAMSLYALAPGSYRLLAIDGFDCGEIPIHIKDATGLLALGTLAVQLSPNAQPRLRRAVPTGAEIDRIASLGDVDPATIDARPVETLSGRGCTRFSPYERWPQFDPEFKALQRRQAILSGVGLTAGIALLVIFPPSTVAFSAGVLTLGL